MGLFSKTPPKTNSEMYECKACPREVPADLYVPEYEMCRFCVSEALAFLNVKMGTTLTELEASANAETNPEKKIEHLTSILNILYEYKIKYADNDIDLVKMDIDDLIDEIIDAISRARL